MSKLSTFKLIGEAGETKLADAGIHTVEALLEACSAKKGRSELAKTIGVDEKQILKWANLADLTRIKGVGSEYSELLEAAGVDTIPELATRKAANLFKKMLEINEAESHVKKLPTEAQVEDWVKQASELPRMLNY